MYTKLELKLVVGLEQQKKIVESRLESLLHDRCACHEAACNLCFSLVHLCAQHYEYMFNNGHG